MKLGMFLLIALVLGGITLGLKLGHPDWTEMEIEEYMKEKSLQVGASIMSVVLSCLSKARDSKLEGDALISFCRDFLQQSLAGLDEEATAKWFLDSHLFHNEGTIHSDRKDFIVRAIAKRVAHRVQSEKTTSEQAQDVLGEMASPPKKKTSTTKDLASATWVEGDGGVTLEVYEKTSTHEGYGRWASLGLRARVQAVDEKVA